MRRNHPNYEDLEQLLLHSADAERAGVFNRSPVDPAVLLAAVSTGGDVTAARAGGPVACAPGSDRSRGWMYVAGVLAPIAACVAIWFGVNQFANGEVDCYDFLVFDSCFTGPSGADSREPLSGQCACVDLDQDGDVDFADFGHLQRLVTSRRG